MLSEDKPLDPNVDVDSAFTINMLLNKGSDLCATISLSVRKQTNKRFVDWCSPLTAAWSANYIRHGVEVSQSQLSRQTRWFSFNFFPVQDQLLDLQVR